MYSKTHELLINPTEKELLEREPLMAFSFYLSGRHNVLLDIADEIVALLNQGFSNGVIDSQIVCRADTLMWLWTLGAYEVVRTMSQSQECFTNDFLNRLKPLKNDLAIVRMPNSKMEKRRKAEPVTSNRSPFSFDFENKDILVGDPDTAISARHILNLYASVIATLSIDDVQKAHEESYKNKA